MYVSEWFKIFYDIFYKKNIYLYPYKQWLTQYTTTTECAKRALQYNTNYSYYTHQDYITEICDNNKYKCQYAQRTSHFMLPIVINISYILLYKNDTLLVKSLN